MKRREISSFFVQKAKVIGKNIGIRFCVRSNKRKGKIMINGNITNSRKENPFQNPPYEKLLGELQGADLRRINIQHRLVYEVDREAKVVKVLSAWTEYKSI